MTVNVPPQQFYDFAPPKVQVVGNRWDVYVSFANKDGTAVDLTVYQPFGQFFVAGGGAPVDLTVDNGVTVTTPGTALFSLTGDAPDGSPGQTSRVAPQDFSTKVFPVRLAVDLVDGGGQHKTYLIQPFLPISKRTIEAASLLTASDPIAITVADPDAITVDIGVPGPEGKSAYQLAVLDGFQGSLTDWLAGIVTDDQVATVVADQITTALPALLGTTTITSSKGNVPRRLADRAADLSSVLDLGWVDSMLSVYALKGDAQVKVVNVTCNASSNPNNLVLSAVLSAAAIGNSIAVPGAGAGGSVLVSKITGFSVDMLTVTLQDPVQVSLAAASTTIDYGTDDTQALIYAATNVLGLYFPMNRRHLFTGNIPIKSGAGWFSMMMRGPAASASGGAVLVPIGKGYVSAAAALAALPAGSDPSLAAFIYSANPASPISNLGMANLNIDLVGEYTWAIHLRHPSGYLLSYFNVQTALLDVGGICCQKIAGNTGSSWIQDWTQVRVILPQAAKARPLDIDSSDSCIVGGTFSGGWGPISRGAGVVKFIGPRFSITNSDTQIPDRTGFAMPSAAGLTVSKESNSYGTTIVLGCQIEENTGAGLIFVANPIVGVTDSHFCASVDATQFRNHGGAIADIWFVNNTGTYVNGVYTPGTATVMQAPTLGGGNKLVVVENDVAVGNHILFDDITKWRGINIAPQLFKDQAGCNFMAGTGASFQAVLGPNVDNTHRPNDPTNLLRQTHTTYTLPGGSMGPNDSLEVKTLWTHDGNTAAKLISVAFGNPNGGTGSYYLNATISTSSSTCTAATTIIRAAGTRNAQKGLPPAALGTGSFTGGMQTSTVDTTQDVVITFSSLCAAGGSNIALEGYTVTLNRDPQ